MIKVNNNIKILSLGRGTKVKTRVKGTLNMAALDAEWYTNMAGPRHSIRGSSMIICWYSHQLSGYLSPISTDLVLYNTNSKDYKYQDIITNTLELYNYRYFLIDNKRIYTGT